MLRFLAVLIVSVGLATVALGQPFLDRVPESAIAYVGWKGTTGLGEGYQNSHAKAVLAECDAQKLFTEFLPGIVARVGRDNPAVATKIEAVRQIGGYLWRYPSAICFMGLDLSNPRQPVPQWAVLCDAGAEAPQLQAKVAELAGMVGQPPFAITVRSYGSVVVVSMGPADAVDAMFAATAGKSLKQNPAFQRAMAQVQKDPVGIVYVDAQKAVALIDQWVTTDGHRDVVDMWPRLRQGLGLSSFTQCVCTGGFEGMDWSSAAFIGLTAPRKGLATLLSTSPLSDDALAVVPGTATTVIATKFDIGKVVTDARQAVAESSPNAAMHFDQALGAATMFLGVNLQTDLLDPLGDEWVVYCDPNTGGYFSLGMVAINRLDDPVKAQRGMAALGRAINNVLVAQLRRSNVSMAVRQMKHGDLTIHYLAVPIVAPCWAIQDGHLYMAMYPQVIAAAAAHGRGVGQSILRNPQFMAMRKSLGNMKVSGIEYYDLPRTAPVTYPMWMLMSRYAGFGDLFGIASPAMVVPPLDVLIKHVGSAGAVAWSDEAGWHSRGRSPFPGAEMLASDPSMTVAAPALMTSILLPSLAKARESANRIKCASNMRQLGQGMMLYSNEHRGNYPPDLGTLVVTEPLSLDVLICPSGSQVVPADVRRMAAAEQAKWINQNSSYVYVGAGKTSHSAPDAIVLYENPANHGTEGINVLYADGHVEWTTDIARITAEVQSQNEKPMP